MTLRVVKCQGHTLSCFYENLKEESIGEVRSLEESRQERRNSIIVGKIIKVITTLKKYNRLTVLIKEVLPNCEYGKKFKAVIYNGLAVELLKFSLETGDRIAFFQPFIFQNPTFQIEDINHQKIPNYILETDGVKGSLIWVAKKKLTEHANNNEKILNSVSSSQNKPEKLLKTMWNNKNDQASNSKNNSDTSKESGVLFDVVDKLCHDVGNAVGSNQKKSLSDACNVNTTLDMRLKPTIKLPLKPHFSRTTHRTNPRYNLKYLKEIKSDALKGNMGRVNMIAVVKGIIKPITKTSMGRFTTVCEVTDDTLEKNKRFLLHFFTLHDTIIKEIAIGDVLRLVRVKIELFNGDSDGRVFSNSDVIVFKKDCHEDPISTEKTTFTEEEIERVKTLEKWYEEVLLMKKLSLLENIHKEGLYTVLCKVLSEPILDGTKIILKVTDGSTTSQLTPSIPLNHYHGQGNRMYHIVTLINVSECQKEYAELKTGNFVILPEVRAYNECGLRLSVSRSYLPRLIHHENEAIMEIKRRISIIDNKHDYSIADVKSGNLENSQTIQQEEQFALNEKKHLFFFRDCIQKEKSYVKKRLFFSENKNKIDQRNITQTNIDGNLDSATVKTRKALFSANYGDLSDATEEDTLEILEKLTESGGRILKKRDEIVVTPANTSFFDLINLVKTKYCSPRKLHGQSQDPHGCSSNKRSCRHKREQKEDDVSLRAQDKSVDLVEETDEKKIQYERTKNFTSYKKRSSNNDELNLTEELLEEASTVINMAFQDKGGKTTAVNKNTRVESESTVLRDGEPEGETAVDNNVNSPETMQEDEVLSITNWLFHSDSRHTDHIEDESKSDELELVKLRQILFGEYEPPDLSLSADLPSFNLQLFLIEIIPEPTNDPLDLVSGYCKFGCQNVFIYSTIHWVINNEPIPLCPSCIKIQQERELQLMFMMELHVMDTLGSHSTIIVCREHAELFLSCPVRDFLKDAAIRKSRTQLILDYKIQQNSSYTPVLIVSVTQVEQMLFVVNSRL